MAGAPDYTIGFSLAEVEEIFAAHKAELKSTMARFSDSGSSVDRIRIDEIHAVIAACQRALQKLDPANYGSPGSSNKTAVSGISGYLPK